MALITYLTRILFDHGALSQIGDELKGTGISRPLIVTDTGLVATGLLGRLREALPSGLTAPVFDGTPPNPTEAATLKAVDVYRAEGCDGVIGFGGGSSMDLAKAVALLATHKAPITQYALVEGGVARIRADVAPMIAIPTTAGTGSEVGRGAVIVLEDGRKVGLISPYLIPKVALCDPDLTLDLPPGLTAATGLDALAHGIETFISPVINPPAGAIGLDCVGRVVASLETAVTNGHDREARWNMMMAAMEGAMAFQKGLGAVHALSHPLGGLPDLKLHHGTLNAVLLAEVLRFNLGHIGDKGARLAETVGAGSAEALPEWMTAYNKRLGIPAGLGAMGVTEAMLPGIAEAGTRDHCHATNPRPATAEDYLGILRASMG